MFGWISKDWGTLKWILAVIRGSGLGAFVGFALLAAYCLWHELYWWSFVMLEVACIGGLMGLLGFEMTARNVVGKVLAQRGESGAPAYLRAFFPMNVAQRDEMSGGKDDEWRAIEGR